jgi:hypothetical protein
MLRPLILFALLGNTLYVHKPPNVLMQYICLNKERLETYPTCYKPMTFLRVNDTNVFTYNLSTNRSFFKILSLYPNRSQSFSPWFSINESKCFNNKEDISTNSIVYSNCSYLGFFILIGMLILLYVASFIFTLKWVGTNL